jgi:YbbR domain-containing protein
LILSIVAAIVIWAYVTAFVNPMRSVTIENVQVNLTNAESLATSNLTVSSGEIPTVNIKVQGPRSVINKLTAQDITATANLVGLNKGINAVPVELQLPDLVKAQEIRPNKIDIRVEDLITVTKPIQLIYTGDFSADQEAGFLTVNPLEIEVAGTKEKVNEVTHINAVVDSSELSEESTTLTLEPIPVNKDGDPVINVKLSRPTIELTASLCQVKKVPFRVNLAGELPKDVAITRTDIKDYVYIRGAKEAVAKVKEITAEDIDMSKITETTVVQPNFNMPKGLELADASKDMTITIEIEGVETRSFEYTAEQIEVRGINGSYQAHVNTGLIRVIVMAPGSVIEDIQQKDIQPFVDLSETDMTKNSANLPVQFEYGKNITKVISNPAEVHIIIVSSAASAKNVTTVG